MEILQRAKGILPELIEIRRCLHRNPETGNNLPKTKAFVCEQLKNIGFECKELGGGLVAKMDNGKNKTILLRADMDALPMKEESGLDFASAKEDAAHCCGHDIHTSILIGTIRLLQEMKDDLGCNVVFMFQDDEERASGCRVMVDEGVLENVDYAFGIHVKPDYPVGMINVTAGQKTASYDKFSVEVIGKGGHGAFPKLAIDPIKIACDLTMKLDDLPEKLLGKDTKGVVTIGMFKAGSSPNTIPDKAVIEGTIRTNNEADRKRIKEEIASLCKENTESKGAKAIIEYGAMVPSVTNNPELIEQCREELTNNLKDKVNFDYDFLNASEDFGIISATVPSVYYNVGTGLKEDGYLYPNHNPKVIYDETAIAYGVAALVSSVLAIR